ncbi:hypothetical protein GCM10022402_34990 [Salinactinospora qingdaonensis]|uniref:Uncharacterized protein n=1 Tax=Salinactinospora qingdaonensis TaxID=702744 RepID=A0ABP7G2E0_9ACTN
MAGDDEAGFESHGGLLVVSLPVAEGLAEGEDESGEGDGKQHGTQPAKTEAVAS